jgi:uncharacterized protein (DUF58 family)
MAGKRTGLTARGGCLLAAGLAAAVCAVVLDERDFLRIGAFAVAVPLLALPYARLLRAGVTARRELVSSQVSVGEEAAVRLHVSARSRMPGGEFTVEDCLPDALGASPRFRLGAPARRAAGGRTLHYTIRSPVRGVHTLGPARLSAGDPLGLARSHAPIGRTARLRVFPAVTALPPGGPGDRAGEPGGGGPPGSAGAGEPDVMVREYRHGDGLRKVHWRSTARRDELMVRTEEPPVEVEVPTTVLLDHRASAHRGSRTAASMEWAVSFAGSVCAHLGRRGRRYRLLAADGTVLADDSSTRGQQGRERVLDRLARLPRSPERDLCCPPEPGRRLVAVLGAARPADAEALAASRCGGPAGVAVLLDVDTWRGTPLEAGSWEAGVLLRDAGWTVVHAGAEHDPAWVWSELLGGSVGATPVPGGRR